MKNFLKVASIAAFVAVPMQSNANENIPFSGTVTGACVINVGANGVMAATTDLQTFGSTVTGGSAGTASVLSNGGGFNLFVNPVTSFDNEPVADVASTETFTASYGATGATSAPTGTTGSTPVNAGNTSVTVDLVAVKSGADVFAAGSYDATVVLRCE